MTNQIMRLLWLLCLLELDYGIATTEKYDANADLLDGKIKLFWTIDQDVITFEVHGRTTGWVGIGLSPGGGMIGADIYIGWVADNEAYVTDRHGVGNTIPPEDTENNVKLISGIQKDGWTMLKFSRELLSPDDKHDNNITIGGQRVIFALGPITAGEKDLTLRYHGSSRGTASIEFLKPEVSSYRNKTEEYLDIVHKNFEIPPMDTFYSCFFFKLPENKEKHHVVKVEPIIQKENQRHVHHMALLTCERDYFVPEKNWDEPFPCRNHRHPTTCGKMIMVWAVGGKAFDFPKHVGLPIFGNGDRYFLMEIHYDNPELKQGLIDNSGMRMTYTRDLRPYDVGILAVGMNHYRSATYIPPQASNFMYPSHCSSQCLKHFPGDCNIKFSTRDGKELPMLAKDDSYNFDFQHFRLLPEEIEIKATDHLEVDCYYETMDRLDMTVAGESTRQEMCFSFILYYPQTEMTFCQSTPSPSEIFRFVNITEFSWDSKNREYRVEEPLEHRGKPVIEYMNQINWTPALIDEFSLAQRKMTQLQYCYRPVLSNSKIYSIDMPDEVLEN